MNYTQRVKDLLIELCYDAGGDVACNDPDNIKAICDLITEAQIEARAKFMEYLEQVPSLYYDKKLKLMLDGARKADEKARYKTI